MKKEKEEKRKRIFLRIAYDGTNYVGWQIQKNGLAVEEVINQKLSDLTGEKIIVIGASRTDSGVHAMGNVAVFDTMSSIPPTRFSYALNQRLPEDIRIQESFQVADDFHPRYTKSISKTYEYKVLNCSFERPTERFYTHYVYFPMNLEKMREAAQYIIGEHDFKSFCSMHSQVQTTVRTIYDLEIQKENDIITFSIRGNGFLYNMVRIIVGTLLKVGGGAYPPEHVKEIIEACDRSKAGPKVPAKGLTLLEIAYGDIQKVE